MCPGAVAKINTMKAPFKEVSFLIKKECIEGCKTELSVSHFLRKAFKNSLGFLHILLYCKYSVCIISNNVEYLANYFINL